MKRESILIFSCGNESAELRTESRPVAKMLAHIFRPFLVGVSEEGVTVQDVIPDGGPWAGEVDGETYTGATFSEAVGELQYAIDTRLLSSLAQGLLLHAVAVANDVHQIVLLGPCYAGKTTLAMELVRRGYVYVGDDYVAFDRGGGTLFPFPKGVEMREIVGELPKGPHLELAGHPEKYSYCMPDNRTEIEPMAVSELCFMLPRRRASGEACVQMLTADATLAELIVRTRGFSGREELLWPGLSRLAVEAKACAFHYSRVEDLDVALGFFKGSSASFRPVTSRQRSGPAPTV